MTREQQIEKEAIDYSEIEDNFMEYDDCGDVCDDRELIEKAFIQGAKWADKNPNLYNDEKYQTVKVSCLDELNRKAQLYDDSLIFKSIDEACEWIKNNKHLYKVLSFVGSNMDWDRFIWDFRKAMEE